VDVGPLRSALERFEDAVAAGDFAAARVAAGDLVHDAEHAVAAGVRLERSARLVDLGGMVAEVAHELRQPLLAIKAFGQMLEAKPSDPVYVAKRAARIVKAAWQMEEIIARTLRYARGDAPDGLDRLCDINEAIGTALEVIAHSLTGSRVRVELDLAEGLPRVAVSPVAIQQVFVNLLVNSRDAYDGQPGVVREALGDGVFAAFATTKADGNGLGLHLSRRIAEAAGGTLVLRPADVGATLVVSLPAATC
jgi:signal transduction histidine kinase